MISFKGKHFLKPVDIDVNIRHLEKRLNLLEEKAMVTIESDAKLHQQYTLLT